MTPVVGEGAGTPDVTVVVVSYRTRELTLRCLESVVVETPHLAIEVVVVDNASDDGTVDAIRRRFPDVTVIANDRNVGFAVACNQGAAAGRGRYVLLLNPDAVVLDRAIERLVEWADLHPRHRLYGGRTIDADGRLDPRSCFAAPTLWSTFCTATGLSGMARSSRVLSPDTIGGWDRSTVREVGVITGCFLLVARSAWDRLDGMDERYFLFDEDTDLSVRARAAGYRPVHVPSATVGHVYGASTALRVERLVLLHRARATFFAGHWPGWRGRVALALLLAGVALRAVLARIPIPRAAGLGPYAEVWRRRDEWRGGYVESGSPSEAPGSSSFSWTEK